MTYFNYDGQRPYGRGDEPWELVWTSEREISEFQTSTHRLIRTEKVLWYKHRESPIDISYFRYDR